MKHKDIPWQVQVQAHVSLTHFQNEKVYDISPFILNFAQGSVISRNKAT